MGPVVLAPIDLGLVALMVGSCGSFGPGCWVLWSSLLGSVDVAATLSLSFTDRPE